MPIRTNCISTLHSKSTGNLRATIVGIGRRPIRSPGIILGITGIAVIFSIIGAGAVPLTVSMIIVAHGCFDRRVWWRGYHDDRIDLVLRQLSIAIVSTTLCYACSRPMILACLSCLLPTIFFVCRLAVF